MGTLQDRYLFTYTCTCVLDSYIFITDLHSEEALDCICQCLELSFLQKTLPPNDILIVCEAGVDVARVQGRDQYRHCTLMQLQISKGGCSISKYKTGRLDLVCVAELADPGPNEAQVASYFLLAFFQPHSSALIMITTECTEKPLWRPWVRGQAPGLHSIALIDPLNGFFLSIPYTLW